MSEKSYYESMCASEISCDLFYQQPWLKLDSAFPLQKTLSLTINGHIFIFQLTFTEQVLFLKSTEANFTSSQLL